MSGHNIKAQLQQNAGPASAITDVTVTFTSAAWDGSTDPTAAEANKIIADLAALETAVNALIAALEDFGIASS